MQAAKELVSNQDGTINNAQNESEQGSAPANYEWPPTPTPNPIYYCVIA
jgi:hypothetical protein